MGKNNKIVLLLIMFINFKSPKNNPAYLLSRGNAIQFNLFSFVKKASYSPFKTIQVNLILTYLLIIFCKVLKELLSIEPERIEGLIELGMLKHFNAFLQLNVLSTDVLNILAHKRFPFNYDQILKSGLGQMLYSVYENKNSSHLKPLIKKIFKLWKACNKQKTKKCQKRVKFLEEQNIVRKMLFQNQDDFKSFQFLLKKEKKILFQPRISWKKPPVLEESTVKKMIINKRCLNLVEPREKSIFSPIENLNRTITLIKPMIHIPWNEDRCFSRNKYLQKMNVFLTIYPIIIQKKEEEIQDRLLESQSLNFMLYGYILESILAK